MNKIILTGGGSAGHVTPHFALLDYFKNDHIKITYIGSKNGIEKDLVKENGIPYLSISTGKLRRYLAVKNFTDPFRILAGFFQSLRHLYREKPQAVFSKGGFVSVPVVMAAWFLKIPVILHESDMTPGLANKLSKPFSKKICVTFSETLDYVGTQKGIHTGSPIRSILKSGNPDLGYALTGFTSDKPIIMMMGGSIGSVKINNVLRKALPEILKKYQLIHLCGKGNIDTNRLHLKGYCQYEYVSENLKDLFAITDMMISRAGSNAINEFLYLQLPSLLIPLSKSASRGDQILNARSFEQKGFSLILDEESLTPDTLIEKLNTLYERSDQLISNMRKSTEVNGTENIYKIIKSYLA